jgi:hypothetical protein
MQHEVFVIGAPRSGTTAVAQALRSSGYAGVSGEGHVLTLLPLLRRVIAHYRYAKEGSPPDAAVSQFSWQGLQTALDGYFRDFFASLYDGKVFVDKTPYDSVDYPVADIRRLWPNARILYCQRNGIDNVNSQMRKFGRQGMTFASACMGWASAVSSWLKVAESVADMSIVVEHAELLSDPAGQANRIGAFLHLDDAQTKAFAQALLSDFPEYTGEPSKDQTWSDEERQVFLEICGPLMRRCGYDLSFANTSRATAVLLYSPALLASAQSSIGEAAMGPPGRLLVEDRDISLHPPMPGGESRLTFSALRVSNCRQFTTLLELRNALSETVRFQFEISPAGRSEDKVRHVVDLPGDGKRLWTVSLPTDLEFADVSLITSMAPGTTHNQFAWAVFSNPRLV